MGCSPQAVLTWCKLSLFSGSRYRSVPSWIAVMVFGIFPNRHRTSYPRISRPKDRRPASSTGTRRANRLHWVAFASELRDAYELWSCIQHRLAGANRHFLNSAELVLMHQFH